jgi:hypothetical protein
MLYTSTIILYFNIFERRTDMKKFQKDSPPKPVYEVPRISKLDDSESFFGVFGPNCTPTGSSAGEDCLDGGTAGDECDIGSNAVISI